MRQTIAWLDTHGIPYWDICFMKQKDQVGVDIYIEDSPENLEKLRRRGHYAICFANSTNIHLGQPKADNWDEVYDLVKLEPLDFIARLAGMVPKPRVNLTRLCRSLHRRVYAESRTMRTWVLGG